MSCFLRTVSVRRSWSLASAFTDKISNQLRFHPKAEAIFNPKLSSYQKPLAFRQGQSTRFSSLSGGQHNVQPWNISDVDNGQTMGEHSKDVVDVLRTERDNEPAHYFFKIKSFSTLLEQKVEKLESNDFEAGGYKWKLCLYPKGNEEANGRGYLSLYLVVTDRDKFPLDWKLNVKFKLFVYNHMKENYLTVQDFGGKARRLHAMKTECGFPQLLSLDTFNDKSNGYLFGDSCIFGAEVNSVVKYTGKGECISWIKEPKNKCFTWKVNNFGRHNSSIFNNESNDSICSDEFTVGGKKWKLELYPGGQGDGKGKSLSLFLRSANSSYNPLNHRIFTKFKLRIKDQISSTYYERSASCWFSPDSKRWGFDFMKLCDVKDISKGYVRNDTLIAEVEFMVITETKIVS